MIEFIDDIEEHFKAVYPKEGCGVFAVSKGKKRWVPCTNVAEEREDFIMDSSEYFKIRRTSDIVGIVHSHPDSSCDPSEMDIKYCNALGIPYYIFSYPSMELRVLQPELNITDLYGREYKFGITDCFEAVRDYLKAKDIKIAPRVLFEDDWWEKGLDYFTEENLSDWGFQPIELKNSQANDVLVFKVAASVPNHCGVYLGNDVFYHHAAHRLSCRESLYPSWIKHITGAYRYVS
jgi:proteasome lid subunit RPN8/RPN11